MNTVKDGPFCPKCNCNSGDSWWQCEDGCPLKMSPYYDYKLEYHFAEEVEQFYKELYGD